MRTEHLFFSLAGLLLSFILIGGGLFFILFPHVIFDLRSVGIFSVSLGVFLLLIFFLLSRRRYLLLKMGGVEINEKLLCRFAQDTLQNLFPLHSVECDLILHKKGKIEILAHIPYLSEERREEKLEEIESALSVALLKYCGWKGSFIFNVSFS